MRTHLIAVSLLSAVAACSDPSTGGNEEEVITTVILTFTPSGGGAPITAIADDPDGDGGQPPTIDSIGLTAGQSYALAIGFENRLESPAEIITDEVRDESDAHQIFLTGSAVAGPASDSAGAALTHAYADTDANGLPVGLANTITVAAAAGGELTVTLRHLPPVNGVATKTAGAADTVRASGVDALGGATDARVTFPVAIAVP